MTSLALCLISGKMSSLKKEYFMPKIDYYLPLCKDKIYHLYNRGNGKERLFYTDENYNHFLRLYRKYLYNDLNTFAYCLMPNHFHLLVRITNNVPQIVSENFRKFFISYSMAINIQEERKGNLFQRTFKRKIIEEENYLYAAIYYIHANPVHHGIINDLTLYKFSSFNDLFKNNGDLLCRNEIMEWFEGVEGFFNYHKKMNDYYDYDFLIEDI